MKKITQTLIQRKIKTSKIVKVCRPKREPVCHCYSRSNNYNSNSNNNKKSKRDIKQNNSCQTKRYFLRLPTPFQVLPFHLLSHVHFVKAAHRCKLDHAILPPSYHLCLPQSLVGTQQVKQMQHQHRQKQDQHHPQQQQQPHNVIFILLHKSNNTITLQIIVSKVLQINIVVLILIITIV